MKAMILAAGLGKRLRPITDRIPKAMMPVFGTPIIELVIRQLGARGIRDVMINLHHLPVQIIQHLRDGSPWDLRISYSLEPTILGTAGGIKKMGKWVDNSAFIVVNADTYRDMDLERLLTYHRTGNSVVTMLLERNSDLPPDRAVWLDRAGRVTRFTNVFCKGMTQAISTDFLGVQVIEPQVLSYIPHDQPWELGQVYAQLLNSGLPIAGLLHDGYWKDLGTLNGYRQIHVDTLDGLCPLDVPGRQKDRGIWVGEGVSLEPGVVIEPPIYLGPHTVVRRKARIGPYAVVGKGCIVEREARVVRSILWEDLRVTAHRVVEDLFMGEELECAFSSIDRIGTRQ